MIQEMVRITIVWPYITIIHKQLLTKSWSYDVDSVKYWVQIYNSHIIPVQNVLENKRLKNIGSIIESFI